MQHLGQLASNLSTALTARKTSGDTAISTALSQIGQGVATVQEVEKETPFQRDQRLEAWLLQLPNCVKHVRRLPPTYDAFSVELVDTPDEESLSKAIAALSRLMRPLEHKACTDILTALRLKCRKKEGDELSETLLLASYLDEFRHFPADVVYHVIKNWCRNEGSVQEYDPHKMGWFPAASELINAFNGEMYLRNALRRELNKRVMGDERG